MARKSVFFSFHFDNDYWRTHQIRNIGVIEKKEPLSKNEWEEVQRKGESSIRSWIDDNLKFKNCTIVLIGEETYKRPWVLYEIEKSWNMQKGLLGIYIHKLRDNEGKTSRKGLNPFDEVFYDTSEKLSKIINVYNPEVENYQRLIYPDKTDSQIVYKNISENIEKWVDDAIKQRDLFKMFGH